MVFFHRKRILAIDSQEVNTKGANTWKNNLTKKWNTLELRAQERKDGKTASSRKQRFKAANAVKKEEGEAVIEKVIVDAPNDDDLIDKIPELVNENIKLSTKFVSDETDLGEMIETEYTDYSQRMGMMGLHTCGNLASSSIKIFFATKTAKFICNVGCCYHGLEEEFYRNPYLKADEKSALSPGFPMSTLLREKRFWLGRNARILASQPLGRLADNKNLPSHSLLWRAVLQVMLLQVLPTLSFHDQQVGRIATKSADFVDYVHRAFKKLKLELTFSDDQILEIYEKYKLLYQQKLNCFYQLRSLFAPIIEGIILLDRLLYISDNSNTTSCSVIRLFEPAISPRCYALIACKA